MRQNAETVARGTIRGGSSEQIEGPPHWHLNVTTPDCACYLTIDGGKLARSLTLKFARPAALEMWARKLGGAAVAARASIKAQREVGAKSRGRRSAR